MDRRIVLRVALTLLLVSTLILVFNVQISSASGTVYIRADGNIDPPSANITSADNVTYTLIGTVSDSVVVQRANIVLDGAGYAVQGAGSGTGINVTGANNVTVKNCLIKSFRVGIYQDVGADSAIVRNNTVNGMSGAQGEDAVGIFLKSNYNTIFNNTILNLTGGIGTAGGNDVSGGSGGASLGIYLSSSSGNNLTSNAVSGLTGGAGGTGGAFGGSGGSGGVSAGVYLSASTGSSLTSNAIANLTGGTGGTGGNSVSGGSGGVSAGVYLSASTGSSLTSNAVSGLTGGAGGTGGAFGGSGGSGGVSAGVYLSASTGNSLTSNAIANLTGGAGGTGGAFGGSGGTSYSLYFYQSNLLTIKRNTLETADYGLYLYSSNYSAIYHNNFIGNATRIFNQNSNNTWDNGYPSGGNYWSNYTGVDNYSGPYQNVTGSDGIGDTPLQIDQYNKDNYPLMSQSHLSVSVSPSLVILDAGQSLLFSSSVTGGTSPFTYQWCLNDSAVSGATSSTWTFTASSTGSYNVYINVTDDASFTAQSNTASVTVNPALSVTISPSSSTLDEGQSQLFTSAVSGGTEPYSYQWYLNDTPVSGATEANWTFIPSSAGSYAVYVNATDNVGEQVTSNIAFVTVKSHDVAVVNVTSKTVVGQGYDFNITVRVANFGSYQETFNVTLYATIFIAQQNVTLQIASQNVTLESGNYANITFVVNTAGYPNGNYTLSAYAWPVPGETLTADNNCTCNVSVHVGVPGDVSGTTPGVYDGVTNMKDIAYLVSLFNTKPSSPNWMPNADVNNDGLCNMKDIAIAVYYFNQHE